MDSLARPTIVGLANDTDIELLPRNVRIRTIPNTYTTAFVWSSGVEVYGAIAHVPVRIESDSILVSLKIRNPRIRTKR